MKTYNCLTCGVTFTLGRGRPPLRPLCPQHKPAGAFSRPESAKIQPKNNRKVVTPTSDTNITVRNISEVPMSLEIHGGRPGMAITEVCPNCNYAYADGGYCTECGWSKPINRIPFGTAKGESWKDR